MSTFVKKHRPILLSYPRLVRILVSGKPMLVTVGPDPSDPAETTDRDLWIRFVSFGPEPSSPSSTLEFTAYLSDSYTALEPGNFNPATMQYVSGTVEQPHGTGKIEPLPDETPENPRLPPVP